MAQSRVTEFFSARKRNRFQDDATLAKTKILSAQPNIEEETNGGASPSKRCLRSSARQQQSMKQVIENKETPKQGGGRKKSEKKEKLDQIKARIERFDAQHAKLINEEKIEAAPPVKPAAEKKKLNKEELNRRIEQFNCNLAQIQAEPVVQKEETSTSTNQTSQLPAFEKLKSLAEAETADLALPKSYSVLFDFFKSSDAIAKFLFDRDEVCTFLKLKMGIQNITKRTFTQKQLGQIKAVYPQSYLFKYEKLFIDFKNDYHFIISPNLQGIYSTFIPIYSNRHVLIKRFSEIETNPKTGLKQFTPKVLLDRIGKFKSNLMAILKNLHQV
jgi:hypothetical protein